MVTILKEKRSVLIAGVLLAVLGLSTTASVIDVEDSLVQLRGTNNQFNIVVAGSAEPGWQPTAADWHEGNPSAYQIQLTENGEGYLMSPGAVLTLKVAVKNTSTKIDGTLAMKILDPTSRGQVTNVSTGTYVELFDQLLFTVKDGSTVLLENVPAAELTTIDWPVGSLTADSVKVLDISIEMPESVDNRWQEASTDVQFHFETENL